MFDTLHLEIPSGSSYTRHFVESMAKLTPENREKFERRGEHYAYTRNLRFFDVPALLHSCNVRNPKAGDKFEFIGAGGMTVGEMAGYIHEVFDTNVDDCSIMRLDATADVDGAWVPWCRKHVRVAGKQCVQHETPAKARPGEAAVREYMRNEAETIYWGRGSRQTMVYDKTEQRRYLLQKKRAKLTREERAKTTLEEAFFEEYGYSIFQQVTRFERRMGARESATAFGIEHFGKIQRAAFRNPFSKMNFPENIHVKNPAKELRPMEVFGVRYLQQLVAEDGWANARNEMKRVFGAHGRNGFYRALKLYEAHLMPTGTGLTREDIRRSYLASTLVQLAS